MPDPGVRFRRVLLKLSGEALSGDAAAGIDKDTLASVGGEIASVVALGVQIGVVVGGGNFFRGLQAAAAGFERATADYMGMLATVMNALALQQELQSQGVEARVQSAIPVSPVSEPYVRQRALKHLSRGRVVVFAAGTGNPYFTTDTAASLRAIEIGAELLLKATQAEGVYNDDPRTNPAAKLYQTVSYSEVLERNLRVMDATAIALCREHAMPLRVFALRQAGSLRGIIMGRNMGTLVSSEVTT